MSEITITTEGDEYGTFSYSFQLNNQSFSWADFPTRDEAVKAASFHIRCITNGFKYEMCAWGATFRG